MTTPIVPRLESSARDYAIARLSAGDDLWPVIRDYRGPGYEAAVRAWEHASEADLPLVRARVALYLRLLRRVETWKRWKSDDYAPISSWAEPRWWWGDATECAWRPLWTSAPPHEPGVTARMRRER